MKILLVEDHKLLSEGLKNSLIKYNDIDKVDTIDEPTSIEYILSLISINLYDLILIDINIKKIIDIDGLKLCQLILEKNKDMKIVILTGYDFYALEKEAKELGASGFLYKEINTDILYSKIKDIMLGKKLFKIKENKYTDLTDKESEVVNLYAKGMSRNDISKELNISLRTLANHLNIIYEKLDVKNYQEMLRKATLLGYVKDNIM